MRSADHISDVICDVMLDLETRFEAKYQRPSPWLSFAIRDNRARKGDDSDAGVTDEIESDTCD